MGRPNGPIWVWSREDTTPTDVEGGYAGGDSTAAAISHISGAVGASEYAAQEAAASAQTAETLLYAGLPAVRADANLTALSLQQDARTFTPPAGFTFPILVTPTRDEVGRYTVPDVDVEALHVPGAGPTYYVDPVNGSDSNTGLSWAQAFARPFYAVSKNGNDAAQVICKGGIYLRSDAPAGRQPNLAIRSAPGERAIFTACDRVADASWTLTGGTTWQTPMSAVAGILDNLNQDAEGDPSQLLHAVTLADCQATPGTWFAASGTLHVHLIDDRKPDAQTLVSRSVPSWSMLTFTAPSSFYFDGIEFWGGTGVNMTPSVTGSRFTARRSAFKFATANGLSAWGLDLVVLEDCTAAKNTLDGFNYTSQATGEVSALEINCVGYRNGFQNTGSQNGSTSHNASRVVRVGGSYRANQGANVADVNSASSWNVGVRAAQSLDYGIDFYGQDMWVEHGRSGSRIAISGDSSVNPSPAVRYRATVLAGEVGAAGSTY